MPTVLKGIKNPFKRSSKPDRRASFLGKTEPSSTRTTTNAVEPNAATQATAEPPRAAQQGQTASTTPSDSNDSSLAVSKRHREPSNQSLGVDTASLPSTSGSTTSESGFSSSASASPTAATLARSNGTAASNDTKNGKKRNRLSLDLAKEVVSQIVSRSTITVESLQISDLAADGLRITLHLRIGKTGPAKAKVTFPDGLELFLSETDDRSIGTIELPPLRIQTASRTNGIHLDARIRANSASSGALGLDKLLTRLVAESDQAILRVATPTAVVKAYGMSFKSITMEKSIQLQGLNRLGGALRFASDPPPASGQTPRSAIQDFQIVKGDPAQGILFTAQVQLANPSTVTATFGDIQADIATDVKALRDGENGRDDNAVIGAVILPQLSLRPGDNLLQVHGSVKVAGEGDASRLAGLTLIQYLLENREIAVKVVGSDRSSEVPWVADFFKQVVVSASLPAMGITSRLLDGASLVPPENSGLSSKSELFARATLRNQFGPSLTVHSLQVQAYQESHSDDVEPRFDDRMPVSLGEIQTPPNWGPLVISNEEPVHASLPFNLSADGASYVKILKNEASRKGIELQENLVEALEMFPTKDRGTSAPSLHSTTTASTNRKRRSTAGASSLGHASGSTQSQQRLPPLDLPNLVASALNSLKVAAHITAKVSLGNYEIPGNITFVQHQLPIAITVKTARAILPTVGAPLLDALMEQASISISRLKIIDLDEKGLNVEAEIGLTDFGPLDVEIHPDQGLDIRTLDPLDGIDPNTVLARIIFSEPLRGMAGSTDLLKTRLRILPSTGPRSVSNFATFVSELIKNEAVGLRVSSDTCRIVAGGAEFVAAISKTLNLPGLAGLKGLTIDEFEILDEVPAPTGPGRGRALSSASTSSSGSGSSSKEMAFLIRARVKIPHAGQLAVALSKIEAGIEYQGTQIGVVSAEDIVFSLAPGDLEFEANGYILVGREGLRENQPLDEYRREALAAFGRVASKLLAGRDIELTARGYRAFAMGDAALLTPSRAQIPSHLRSKASSNSVQMQRSASSQLSRSGSISTLTSGNTANNKQVPWLDQAFQKFSTTVLLRRQDIKPFIGGIELNRLHASFGDDGQLNVQIDEIMAQVQIPFPVNYTVLAIKAQIEVHFDGHGCIGRGDIDESSSTTGLREMSSSVSSGSSGASSGTNTSAANGARANGSSANGSMQLSNGTNGTSTASDGIGAAQHNHTSATPTTGHAIKQLRIKPTSFSLVTENSSGLAELIAHLADCDVSDKVSVRGRAAARVETALGELWVDIDLGEKRHPLTIQGLRGLRSSPVQYTNLQVVEASPEFLKIIFSLYLNNPSKSLSIMVGPSELTMGAYYRGSYVGRAYIGRGFELPCGPVNVHDIHFKYCPRPEDEKHVRDIPANFLSGRSTVLEIRGDDSSTQLPVLNPALKNIRLSFELKPMIDRTLIDSISITLGVSALTAAAVEATFVVNNPLGVPFDLCAMSFMASYQGSPFGSCTVQFQNNNPLRVPPGSPKQPGQQQSSPVIVTLAQPLEKMVGAFLKSKGSILLDLDVTAKVEIQGFQIPVFNYRQPKLPLNIKGLEAISKWMKFLP
ncbi:hypothetical protein BCV70DRAFT_198143 [Testicularia cyperi]|uniref:Uncharacterized protein n=1 Tax=Testicularia cyperi TaxID=1882483 RepID=A0A317XU87_9BASI|nr:hypothetical protein BCV70DRAFT_198143 [Testicularia cyperi]